MYLVFLRMNQFSSTCAWHAGKYKEAPHGRVTIWICRDEGCLPPQPRPRPRRRRAPRVCAWDSQSTIWRDCCSWRQVPGVQNKYVEWSRSNNILCQLVQGVLPSPVLLHVPGCQLRGLDLLHLRRPVLEHDPHLRPDLPRLVSQRCRVGGRGHGWMCTR